MQFEIDSVVRKILSEANPIKVGSYEFLHDCYLIFPHSNMKFKIMQTVYSDSFYVLNYFSYPN